MFQSSTMYFFPKVSIIIVNYNSSKATLKCIESVLDNTPPTIPYEVIVVDNASRSEDYADLLKGIILIRGTHRDLPGSMIRLVRLSKNYGYAGGNNIGAKLSRGEYLVILNPDVVVTKGWLAPLIEALSSSKNIAAVQGKILLPDGSIDSTGIFMDIYGNLVKRGYNERDFEQYDNIAFREVFSVSGAAFAIKRDLFLKVGGFRTRYFMYFEEIDLSWRLRLLGYSILYVPTSVVYHMHPPGVEEQYDKSRRARFRYLETRNKMYSILSNSCSLKDMLLLLMGLLGGVLSDIVRSIKVRENRVGPRLIAILHTVYNLREVISERRKYCNVIKRERIKLNILKIPLPVAIYLLRIKAKYGGVGFRKAYNKFLQHQQLFTS